MLALPCCFGQALEAALALRRKIKSWPSKSTNVYVWAVPFVHMAYAYFVLGHCSEEPMPYSFIQALAHTGTVANFNERLAWLSSLAWYIFSW